MFSTIEAAANELAGGAWRAHVGGGGPRAPLEAVPWGRLPLSSFAAPVAGAVTYLCMLRAGKAFMAPRPALSLRMPLFLHNAALAVFSGVLFVFTCICVAGVYSKRGFSGVWNDPDWLLPSEPLAWCLYVFYLSKFYELLDTAFLVLRKRPTPFVGVWHHVCVLFLFWSYMNARMHNHWVLVALNALVHVFVYGYFAASAIGVAVPWKKMITVLQVEKSATPSNLNHVFSRSSPPLLQIGQFVADMLYSLPFPVLKLSGATPGDWAPWVFGQLVGLSFIVLFAQLLTRPAGAAAARAPAHPRVPRNDANAPAAGLRENDVNAPGPPAPGTTVTALPRAGGVRARPSAAR